MASAEFKLANKQRAPRKKRSHLASLTLPILIAALAIPTGARAETPPKVKTIGVRVIHRVEGDKDNNLIPFTTFQTGTSVALLIASGGRSIIKVDQSASKLDSFQDDQGNDLLVKTKGFAKNGLGAFPKISDDKKSVLVEIDAAGVPDKKAARVEVEGTIALQLASKKTKIKSAPFEIKKDAVVKIGEIEMTLKRSGKRSFNEEGVELNFQTNDTGITLVANVKFFDASGTEIPSEAGSTGYSAFGKKRTYSREYELTKAVTGKVSMEFEIWTDMTVEKIPLKIATGISG